jgi:CheY-like chemotaxis protein
VPNLLLVENHEPLRSLWSGLLADWGFIVKAADSGDQAQAIIRSGTPVDVLFSDIRMPGTLDGLQLAGWVRKHYPWIIIVLQTGSLDDLPTKFCILRKPFTASDFLKSLEEAMKARDKLVPTDGILEA